MRFTRPLLSWITAPWGSSASNSVRWPRIAWTPRIMARLGAPLRRTSASRPGSASAGPRPGAEQQRDGAVAELELALDGLGRAVHHAQEILEPVARVERDHALALGVDAAPARAARHLRQLVVGERAKAAVGTLGHALQHDGARRHVDAERHRLRREDNTAEPALEERLDQALETGEDARVVRGHSDAQPLEDGLAQRRLADRRALGHRLADDRVHLAALLARDQRAPVGQHVLHGALAAGAAEDEVGGRQPAARVEGLDEHGGIDHTARVPAPAVVLTARLVADDVRAALADFADVVDVAGEVGDRVVQRHRPVRMIDGHDRPVHDRDPVGDLLDVGHGGGEPDQQHVLGRADDDLLPHGAAALVAHVVTLVEHDVAEVVEAAPEEGVPQNFRGHHEHLRLRIHLHVAGEDADLVGAVGAGEVVELLVRERLERRRVGDAPAGLERALDRVLRHQRLAAPRRRRHDHRLIRLDGADRFDLEVIEGEGKLRAEPLETLHFHHGTTGGRLTRVIVFHLAITTAEDYAAKREPHRRAHLERLQGLRAAGIVIGGGPAPDGRRVDIFYRLQQPGQVTPAVDEAIGWLADTGFWMKDGLSARPWLHVL